MRDLKRTPLRHQILTMISDGGVERARYGELTWDIPAGITAQQGRQQRAVTEVVSAGMAQIVRGDAVIGGPVAVTAYGAQTLVNWDEKHGHVREARHA